MKIIEAISSIKAAIDKSVNDKSDSAWESAVRAAGLVSQVDKGQTGIDTDYIATFGALELRVKHTWRDTSKTFQPGPDRTMIKLDLMHGGNVIDSYSLGYNT